MPTSRRFRSKVTPACPEAIHEEKSRTGGPPLNIDQVSLLITTFPDATVKKSSRCRCGTGDHLQSSRLNRPTLLNPRYDRLARRLGASDGDSRPVRWPQRP